MAYKLTGVLRPKGQTKVFYRFPGPDSFNPADASSNFQFLADNGGYIREPGTSAYGTAKVFHAMHRGRMYFEFQVTGFVSNTGIPMVAVGICNANYTPTTTVNIAYAPQNAHFSYWNRTVQTGVTVIGNADFSNITTGVLGVAVDLDNGAMWFSHNGVWDNGATLEEISKGDTTNASIPNIPAVPDDGYVVAVSDTTGVTTRNWTGQANFGQLPFQYPVPDGFIPGWPYKN